MSDLSTLKVSDFTSFIPKLTDYFINQVDCFKAGRLSEFINIWKGLTSDKEVLNIVMGHSIEFTTQPIQRFALKEKIFSYEDSVIIESELARLLKKGVIEVTQSEIGEFISPIFVTPKPDGSHRLILNLKRFNDNVEKQHFKMDSLWSAVRLMKPNCFMASIDLKDAYYSVPITRSDRKYLKFLWQGKLYQFTCFPNGLSCCPRKFTKLLKPIYTTLRQQGYLSSGYIDDSYLQGDTYNECVKNVVATTYKFHSVGFIAHPNKSVFQPSQKISYLGFILDSIKMIIRLTDKKAIKIKQTCQALIKQKYPVIRDVASLLGQLTASFPGVMYGPLYYRRLDIEKNNALMQKAGNFEAKMAISALAKADLQWWVHSVTDAYNPISHGDPEMTMSTDASLMGWGCCLDKVSAGGNWSLDESKHHINYLEMFAVWLALKSFKNTVTNKHVKLLVDNMTAVTIISHMGTSHSWELNELAKQIWMWCIDNNIWLTIAHIPGIENIQADKESRKTRRETEWTLNKEFFKAAIHRLQVQPTIDLFASRLNFQLPQYVAYQPDPGALAINAFSISWKLYSFYAFPPFSIILQVLQKITEEKSTGLLVVPKWHTQVWWPMLMSMLIQQPLLLPRQKDTLFLPATQEIHKLHQTMTLMFCHLSGDSLRVEEFHRKLQISSNNLGDQVHRSSIQGTLTNGNCTVVRGQLIHFTQLQKMG